VGHVEKHHRKPCGRDGCAHSFGKHGSTKGACSRCDCPRWVTQEGDRETYRARYRDPAGRERCKPGGTTATSLTTRCCRTSATCRCPRSTG
jgi:hypothetical protein